MQKACWNFDDISSNVLQQFQIIFQEIFTNYVACQSTNFKFWEAKTPAWKDAEATV